MTKLTLVPPKTELDVVPLDPGMEALIARRGALAVARTATAGNVVLLERIARLERELAISNARVNDLERDLCESEEIIDELRIELRAANEEINYMRQDNRTGYIEHY